MSRKSAGFEASRRQPQVVRLKARTVARDRQARAAIELQKRIFQQPEAASELSAVGLTQDF